MLVKMNLRQSEGYWKVRWTDPHSGRRLSKGLGSAELVSRRQAEAEVRKLQTDMVLSPDYSPTSITVGDWCERYIAAKADLQEASVSDLETSTGLFVGWIGKDRRLNTISTDEAEAWRIWLGKRGYTLNTIRKHVRNLKAVFAKAVRSRPQRCRWNPFELENGSVATTAKDWTYIDQKGLQKLLDACPDSRWRTLIALGRLAGLRMGEALGLVWADVDLHAKRLTVRPPSRVKEDTTKHRLRTVPIVPELAVILQERFDACRTGEQPVGPMSLSVRYANLKGIAERAGLPAYGKPLHTLRKNWETDMAQRFGMAVAADWSGNSVAVASRHYVRAEDHDFAAAVGQKWANGGQNQEQKPA